MIARQAWSMDRRMRYPTWFKKPMPVKVPSRAGVLALITTQYVPVEDDFDLAPSWNLFRDMHAHTLVFEPEARVATVSTFFYCTEKQLSIERAVSSPRCHSFNSFHACGLRVPPRDFNGHAVDFRRP